MAESEIPVIDISKPSLSVAQEVLDAACTHGFLFIKNDGSTIPQADIDDMFNLVSKPHQFTVYVLSKISRLQVNILLETPIPPSQVEPTVWSYLTPTQVKIILLLSHSPKVRIRNPHPRRRRHQPRLGPHVRRIPRPLSPRGPQGSF
jgi:hypothetical protein